MIPFAFGLVGLLVSQAAINVPRQAFSSCLKQAAASAETQKVSPDQFKAHVLAACSAQASSFKGALVSFDVKNGIKRAQAVEDAQLQVDDYVASSAENYAAKVERMTPKAAPQPQLASQPQ